MKAIQTRYLPATNARGSRIKAWAEGGSKPHSVTIPYPHELSGEEVHKAAALKLCEKLGWPTNLVGGGLPNGDYCFCFIPFQTVEIEVLGGVAHISKTSEYVDVKIIDHDNEESETANAKS